MWVVLLALVGVLALAVAVPRLTGATPYTVLTGSMEPRLPPGTLVVVRPVEPEDVRLGSVITFQLRSGDPAVATHRVVGTGVSTDGEAGLVTKGDANDTPDARPVRPVQLRGEVWYAVPHLGRLSNLVPTRQREAATFAVAAGLLLYAATAFVSVARRPRRKETA